MHASILKYFAEVARSGSIRKASDELHVATSAVSRQIKKLEDELGAPLFERFSDGLRLTAAGEIVLKHAKDTLLKYEIMKSDLGDLQGKCAGRVHIASLDSLAIQFLPEFVMGFHRWHPAVDFRIRYDNYTSIFHFLADGDADIGVTFDLARPHDIKLVYGVPMPLMAMVSRNHPLARQKSVTLQECAQFKLLLQLDNEVMSSMIAVELGALNRVGRTLVATNNQMMLKPLILSGEGVAFFTPLGLLDELDAGEVVALHIAGSQLHNLQVGIVVPRQRQLTHAAEVVIESMSVELKKFSDKIHAVIQR
ncbi:MULTISPECIES: LysR family transcriptional regulator [Rhizobium]|jgi:DNA-binding transcriptional LysR family regulator|uniref:LysR family transcriptional regulator n=1 Tax=Rhizobium TaxID=379 RepID=UPI0010321343|nr:LysR family transcriptional regulator [Rhizobium ruizarguesonis]TBY95124.1 LysR family transcriptional regulator [Rhizobium leguminosarum bv. viciae]NEI25712.1 LysR family transcriptional regulator [Rhizobium ruizarguesonis]TBA10946.1 LysR family transcriptional regulator [Rhizobium ruizarguesonis]TBA52101.1 LysR family transcriptional regulator [Rhizobium ruizarguesonis]TBA73802.1 LysR family transcriptional regulator [Rhizobium ruizarguesonis]